MKLVAIAGALREGSLNKQLLRLACKLLEKDGVEIDLVDLRALAHPVLRRRHRGEHRPARERAGAGRADRGRERARDRVARVQLLGARGAEERDRLGHAREADAAAREDRRAALRVAVAGRRKPRALGAAHVARGRGRARLPRHVLARDRAPGLRRRAARSRTRRSARFLRSVLGGYARTTRAHLSAPPK